VSKGPVLKTLDEFKAKQAEDAATLLWFNSNVDIHNLIMAWGKVPVRKIGGSKPPKNEIERWQWLWTCYEFSPLAWMDMAGVVDRRYGMRLIERIKNLRLVFPDGTLPDWINRYLSLAAEMVIAQATPEPKKPGPEPEGE
jgi:hypothetical protein